MRYRRAQIRAQHRLRHFSQMGLFSSVEHDGARFEQDLWQSEWPHCSGGGCGPRDPHLGPAAWKQQSPQFLRVLEPGYLLELGHAVLAVLTDVPERRRFESDRLDD